MIGAMDRPIAGLHRVFRWWIVDWQRRATGLKGKWGLGASRGRIMTGRPHVAKMVRAGTSAFGLSGSLSHGHVAIGRCWWTNNYQGTSSVVRGTAGSVENEDSPRQVEARSCLLSANGVLSLCRNRAERRRRERRSFIDVSKVFFIRVSTSSKNMENLEFSEIYFASRKIRKFLWDCFKF